VIVNEMAAAVFWPGENAVGKRISFLGEGLPVEVVGVARTANYRGLGEPPQPLVYLSLGQYYFPTVAMYIRTTGNPGTVIAAVRRALQPLERNLPLQPQTLDASIRDLLWSQRLSALLLSAFGFLALLLSLVGIYGVIAYSVRQRRREMGIRMALGATPTDVQFMVLGEGIRLITIGVIAGSIIGLAVAGTVESMLFLKSSRDMFTFTLVPATLTLAGVLACWAPAVSASRADPADALREE
jgi:putative ABC transport system permease protein